MSETEVFKSESGEEDLFPDDIMFVAAQYAAKRKLMGGDGVAVQTPFLMAAGLLDMCGYEVDVILEARVQAINEVGKLME